MAYTEQHIHYAAIEYNLGLFRAMGFVLEHHLPRFIGRECRTNVAHNRQADTTKIYFASGPLQANGG